jgi:hypothetical protein
LGKKFYRNVYFNNDKRAENEFSSFMQSRGNIVTESNSYQDRIEHWDFKILNEKTDKEFKVDVKGLKKISRSDSSYQEEYHFVELQNENGGLGWLYGKCDYFAFELVNFWVFVSKDSLISFIEKSVQDVYVSTSKECYLKKYTREKWGKKDIITMVKTEDLKTLPNSFMLKKNYISNL